MDQNNTSQPNGKVFFRIGVCFAVLLFAFVIMNVLSKMKTPPVEVVVKERPLQVEVLVANAQNVQVELGGFGQVRSLDTVSISAEVRGRIVTVNANLDQGLVIEKGAILFAIDPSDYLAARDTSRAEVDRFQKNLLVLEKQMEIDAERLISIERNQNLAKSELERYVTLYEEHEAVSLSFLERQEQAYNNVKDQAAQMAKIMDLYPLQIDEARSGLAAAQSRLTNAITNLERCEVKAPFTGRVTQASVEVGQYVSGGQQVLAMANDSVLEIHVPIDSDQARKWLRFKDGNSNGWFNDIVPVDCDIRWTDDDTNLWKGILHRVIKFDPGSRTLTVAVRVSDNQSVSEKRSGLPLVEGMFCAVTIPGLEMKKVYRLPRWAVSFKESIYLAVDKRLKTSSVEVARIQGEETFVSKGLHDGDLVIITRLVEPLENSLLQIQNSDNLGDTQKSSSGADI